MEKLRMKLALWLMPEIERWRISDAIKVTEALTKHFGRRAVRIFLHPESIREIQIIREPDQVWH